MRDFFGGKFNLPETEEKVLEFWKTNDIFGKSLKLRQETSGQRHEKKSGAKTQRSTLNAKRFVFYEGPPYANGKPGIHHVLARVIKDILLRYKSMRGYYVPRQAGWDTHGLPVEIAAEKALGLKSKSEIEKFGIEFFNQKAKEAVWLYKDEWENLTRRIGYWLDLKNAYITYENSYVETLWWTLKRIWERKLLYKGHRVVPWCARCGTALSSHELAQGYKEVTDNSVYVKFRLKTTNDKRQTTKIGNQEFKNVYVLSWTTTPWTLPGNVALAVGEKITYAIFRIKNNESGIKDGSIGHRNNRSKFIIHDSFFVAAKDRVNDIFQDNYEIITEISGKELVGLLYEPLFNIPALKTSAAYKIYPADFVTTTDGTGVVHTAVMYGEDDYQLGLKVGLPRHHTVTEDGLFKKEVPAGLAGMPVQAKETEEKILKYLEAKSLKLKTEPHTHEYPFCWRCDSPVLYYARTSWFIGMSRLREQLLAENKKINWVPAHIKNGRFGEWLKEAKDWNLSRERYWGTPLPIWECKKCGENKVIGSFAEFEATQPPARNRYILMRHGEGEQNIRDIVNANPKDKNLFGLTLRGRARTEKAAKSLKRAGVDVIFSSDFRRARETAETVAAAVGKKVLLDERLREINVGVFHGQKPAEYHRYFSDVTEKFYKTPPEGENLRQLAARIFPLLNELEKKYSGKTILLVSHEYPIWMAETVMRGWNEKESVAEKLRRGNDFVKLAEPEEIVFRTLPRDTNGFADFHRPFIDRLTIPCAKCGTATQRIKEVADVWFDSGAMPFAQMHFPFAQQIANGKRQIDLQLAIRNLPFPADYIAEGMDQTRGWFYTLLAVATALGYETPYKNVISLGLINDKNGQKMSKSKGNIVDPWMVIKKYGADAVRWYFYSVNPLGETKNFDEAEVLKTFRRFHMMLYNSLAFWKLYSHPPLKTKSLRLKADNILDQWILARLDETILAVTKNLEKYEIREAALALEGLVDDLSRWYIRRSRARFSAPLKGASATEKKDAAAASATLGFVLAEIAKLIAPFTPFFAEALRAELRNINSDMRHGGKNKKVESVHLSDWPIVSMSLVAKHISLLQQMAEVRRLASIGLAKRTEAGIKVRQPLRQLKVKSDKLKVRDRELLKILADEVNVKEIVLVKKIHPVKSGEAGAANAAISRGKGEAELDTNITLELREEGLVREIGRMVQELRQKAGLKPGNKIALFVHAPAEIQSALQKNEDTFKRDVGAKSVEYKKSDKFDAEETAKIDEGEVWLGLRKK